MITRIHNLNKTRSISTEVAPNGKDILEEIIAEDGMVLTQSADVDIKDRIIAYAVMLGTGHSSTEWKEITKEEAQQLIKE